MKKKTKFNIKLNLIFVISVFFLLSFTILLLFSIIYFMYRTGRFAFRTPLALILFITFFSIVFGTLLSRYASKRFIHAIESISDASKEVAKGNFNVYLDEEQYISEIKTMSQNFNKMVLELNQLDSISQNFVNSVSHEFKTPVSAIEGYATLLQNKNLNKEEINVYTERILYNSARLTSLVTNVLELSKLDHQDISIQKHTFSLDEQIREVILSLESYWVDKNIKLCLDLKHVNYYGSENLFYIVWENLISNVIKFSYLNGTIYVDLYQEEEMVTVKIKDEGIGIKKENQSKIFDRFYQEEKSQTIQGNGLGLSLVKRVIDLHEGSIQVQSEPKKGTEFIIKLKNKGDENES